jgi:microcompartment protein CcmK/EutM
MVSTIKHPDHQGFKLMVVQPIDEDGRPTGNSLVAADAAQAGVGDYVLVLEEGKGCRLVMESKTAPCEALIVGVIDHLTTRGKRRKLAPESKR